MELVHLTTTGNIKNYIFNVKSSDRMVLLKFENDILVGVNYMQGDNLNDLLDYECDKKLLDFIEICWSYELKQVYSIFDKCDGINDVKKALKIIDPYLWKYFEMKELFNA